MAARGSRPWSLIHTDSKETIIIRSSDEVKETIFNDVLKNITSANKILQDLIKNYEQLQNIYKSNEDKAKSSETETEEETTFKAIANINSKENNNGITEATINRFRGRTQMIFEDDTAEDQSTNSQRNNSVLFNANTKGEKNNESVIIDDESSSQSDEIETASNKFNSSSVESNSGIRNGKDSRNKRINKNVQTRFQIQNADLSRDIKRNFNQFSRPNLRLKDDGKKVKRVIYAEVFSPDNLWQEVINKPIDLKVYGEEGVTFRVPDNKRYEKFDVKHSESESLSDSKAEDEIEKEQLKSYLLRNAYGDACLQVAVRKCYKALKNVNKIVCRMQSKCKSSLKSSFKENSKKGCIKQFSNAKKNKSGEDVNFDEVFDRRSKGDTDMSRYIELCLPTMSTRTETKRDILQNETNDVIAINILRDRFEKACKKLSAKKCTNACKFATNAACSTNTCGSKKKAFNKTCKRECKAAYDMIKESSESDDDDDDDASDSD